MSKLADPIVEDVSRWPGLHARDEDYDAVGWTLGPGSIGHVHVGTGVVDVLFTRAVRDQLLREKLAERHRYQPNSGWVTYRIRADADRERARWLLRLSYLRRVVRRTRHGLDADMRRRAETELFELELSEELRRLIES